ncbi:MAG: hypothetical protein V3W26_04140 [Thermodesulfobacteriota bacterium]
MSNISRPTSKWVYQYFQKGCYEGYPQEEIKFYRKHERQARKIVLETLNKLPNQVWEQIKKGNPRIYFRLNVGIGGLALNCECMSYNDAIGEKYDVCLGEAVDDTITAHEIAHAILKHDCSTESAMALTMDEYDDLNIEADALAAKWGFPVEEWLELTRHGNAWLIGLECNPNDGSPPRNAEHLDVSSKNTALNRIDDCTKRLNALRKGG